MQASKAKIESLRMELKAEKNHEKRQEIYKEIERLQKELIDTLMQQIKPH
jgi:hypothetical protein